MTAAPPHIVVIGGGVFGAELRATLDEAGPTAAGGATASAFIRQVGTLLGRR